jgi:hypothetical protein
MSLYVKAQLAVNWIRKFPVPFLCHMLESITVVVPIIFWLHFLKYYFEEFINSAKFPQKNCYLQLELLHFLSNSA